MRVFQILSCVALVLIGAALSVADDRKPQEIKVWGKVVDPDGDCTVKEEKGKLSIKVPGSLHDLFPEQKDPKKRNNAPRVLEEVKGDFVATVKVTADWKPGGHLPDANTLPYNGAGLLVWESDNRFMRLERNVFVSPMGPVSYTTPLLYIDGRQSNMVKATLDEFYKGRSTWLKVERSGNQLTTSISHDGKEWTETAVLTPWRYKVPESVQIGVEAINSSDKEFVVEFDEFKVVAVPEAELSR